MKLNGGTLVIDDFGRQRVPPQDLLNRWIVPLERRVDYLALHTGKKIEVPFEQLVVFSTNLDENDLTDQAFLRRMGYRARVEPPTAAAYSAIFQRAAATRGIHCEQSCLEHILIKYRIERRMMKGCEPRDLLDRATDICRFEGESPKLTPEIIIAAIAGFEAQKNHIDSQIAEIRQMLDGGSTEPAASTGLITGCLQKGP
jgi:hypothetical protein